MGKQGGNLYRQQRENLENIETFDEKICGEYGKFKISIE